MLESLFNKVTSLQVYVFSCEYSEISRNIFYRTPLVVAFTVSYQCSHLIPIENICRFLAFGCFQGDGQKTTLGSNGLIKGYLIYQFRTHRVLMTQCP